MDAEILAVAESRRGRMRAQPSAETPPPTAIPACKRGGDEFCARFGLFAEPPLCAACRSSDPSVRADTVQRLRAASRRAAEESPACRRRSPAIGARRVGEENRAVFICRRRSARITAANCVLCGAASDEPACRLPAAFRVLNARLTPSVPTIPAAEPEVKVFDLYGEHVAFDVNSLCAVQVDEAAAEQLRGPGARAFEGLLFSRRKPQFRLSRAAPVRRLVLNVTRACNLACPYCFAGGDRGGPAMSIETARKGLALLDPRSAVDVAFFGGEPLLAWDLVRQVMDEASDLAAKRRVEAKFHITTNGLLLDAEKIAFLSGKPCSMLVSLDGPEEIHNAARPARDGAVNSFRAAMAALERAKGTPLRRRLMARATFVAAEARLAERLEFLAGLADAGLLRGFSVEPAVLTEGCARRSAPADRQALREEYHAAAVWFVRRARQGRGPGFFHFTKLIERIVAARHMGTECGAGNGYVTVGPDGVLHACHREAGTAVGHVDYGFDEELRAAWADNRLYAREGCMKCWARYLCGGGCRQACLELAGHLRAIAPERCFLQQTMIRECLWILTQLTPEEIAKVTPP